MSFRKIVLAEIKRQRFTGYSLAKLTKPHVKMRMLQCYMAGTSDLTGERLAVVCEVLGLNLCQTRKPKAKGKRQ